MKEVYKAVFSEFKKEPHSDFYNNLNGQLYSGKVPTGTELPYATFTVISNVADHTFNNTGEKVEIQLDIYAITTTQALTLFENCKEVFDNCELSVAGFTAHPLTRSLSLPQTEEEYSRYIVQYSLKLDLSGG